MRKDKQPPPEIRLDAARVIRNTVVACVTAEVLFVLLDATINHAKWTRYGMIRRLFNIAREDSLASWFGTTQTFLVGLTLLLMFLVARRDGATRRVVIGWFVLALFFLYMAADDGAEIHERMGSMFKKSHEVEIELQQPETLGGRALTAFPSYPWQILFMPFFVAVGVFMSFFLWRELKLRRLRILLLVAIACFGTAAVMDFGEGLAESHRLNPYTWIAARMDLTDVMQRAFERRPYEVLRHFSKSFEEFLEMFGTTLLWAVFLTHFTRTAVSFRVRFTNDG